MNVGCGTERIILDADGVFMDELPYWRTGLVVAVESAGLVVDGAVAWESLSRSCFEDVCLQRVTKQRGCNSNWDMTAVMVRALEDRVLREGCASALGGGGCGDARDFAMRLRSAMDALWGGEVAGRAPLDGFGIERGGVFFREVVARFQAVFTDVGQRSSAGAGVHGVDWRFDRRALARPADGTRAGLAALRDRGAALAVCTSRTREEIVGPIADLGIAAFFDPDAIVTYDDVLRAQVETGFKSLSKPHWFPLAVASLGYEPAIRALHDSDGRLASGAFERVIYVGDALADFLAASVCRQRGLPVFYLHVDSGVSGEDVLAEIAVSEVTLAVVSELAGVADVLAEVCW